MIRSKIVSLIILISGGISLTGQTYFNAWLSTCSHLVGPTGNPNTLALAVEQSRGNIEGAPGFLWDLLIDVGDWTASQKPPEHKDGVELVQVLDRTLGKDRGKFFSVNGNHDGDQKGWLPGEFTRRYVNPLGEDKYKGSSGFHSSVRPNDPDYRQLLDYPGIQWDRYLIRTGNVIWIMLGDRNEFDQLAESRGDTSGSFQAGRGSASGMPDGGYPSGAVSLETFEWWKKVIEDDRFSQDILITAHHLMPANTTITTDDGEPGEYHGASGSVGPNGETGGQLYWIREFDDEGKEINQYAQTRPFMNYLKDHPGAIAAWVGGHTHIDSPEAEINGHGIYATKYGVTFISVGALTDSHAGRSNQMTRLITFEKGNREAFVNVYIHQSNDNHLMGWHLQSARKFDLGKPFRCPASSTNSPVPVDRTHITDITKLPEEKTTPRYHWTFDEDYFYDFNNNKFITGSDGSPYGIFLGEKARYSENTPLDKGKSIDFTTVKGGIEFSAPYSPEMTWKDLAISFWLKPGSKNIQEIINCGSENGKGKFRFWFDGTSWIWSVSEKESWKSAVWKGMEIINDKKWHFVNLVVDSDNDEIAMYIDNKKVAKEMWESKRLQSEKDFKLRVGMPANHNAKTNFFQGFMDELIINDVVDPLLPSK